MALGDQELRCLQVPSLSHVFSTSQLELAGDCGDKRCTMFSIIHHSPCQHAACTPDDKLVASVPYYPHQTLDGNTNECSSYPLAQTSSKCPNVSCLCTVEKVLLKVSSSVSTCIASE